jgi:hypothetical protein
VCGDCEGVHQGLHLCGGLNHQSNIIHPSTTHYIQPQTTPTTVNQRSQTRLDVDAVEAVDVDDPGAEIGGGRRLGRHVLGREVLLYAGVWFGRLVGSVGGLVVVCMGLCVDVWAADVNVMFSGPHITSPFPHTPTLQPRHTDLVLDERRDPRNVLLGDGLSLEGLQAGLELVDVGHHLLGALPLVVLVLL